MPIGGPPAWTKLRRREHADNAIAYDWQIQGDGRTRLLGLDDLTREIREDHIPRRRLLAIRISKGTTVIQELEGGDPVELLLSGRQATLRCRTANC